MNRSTFVGPSLGLVGLVAASGLAMVSAPSHSIADGDRYASLPGTIQLTGVVRDFKERTAAGGHPDFERQPTAGFGHFKEMVADQLGEDGKPVFRSTGRKVSTNDRDAAGRNIIGPKEYISSRTGDRAGARGTGAGGALTTEASFNQWFRDVAGVNMSRQLAVSMVRQANSNLYVFDDKSDRAYSGRGGFFPINGELYGNSGGATPQQNFHFSFELETEFVYNAGSGQTFRFIGDDDVWVFVDGKLVIDIGGVHAAVSQVIELDRLNWLANGRSYKLKFFFAERHRTQSNFRIETTMQLRTVTPTTVTNLYD
jgi:fibro-slime domain-containing protein